MKTPHPVLTGILSIGLWAAPLTGEAQPALEPALVGRVALKIVSRRGHARADRLLAGSFPEPPHLEVRHGRQAAGEPAIREPPLEGVPQAQLGRIEPELLERPEGQLVNRDTGQPFSLDDPCWALGGTSGPDPAAYRAALQAVKALVGTEARPSP